MSEVRTWGTYFEQVEGMRLTNRVVVGGGTPTVDFKSGSGIWLVDRSGKRYIDCTSQSWALYLGHAHPEIRDHVSQFIERGWHVHQGFATDEREQFADDLLTRVEGNKGFTDYDRVAFTGTSALAIETAIKLARINRPNREVIGRVRGGFHGTTLGTAQLSWPAQDIVAHSEQTLSVFSPFGPSVRTLDFPDDDAGLATMKLQRQLQEFGDSILLVVVEPIQGSGGQRIVPKQWLADLCMAAERYGFLVAFDEIQTYLRSGDYFSVSDRIRPHFVVLGKGLAGGFNSGGVLIRSDMASYPSGIYDLHTFASSALSHSVGSKLISIIDRDLLLANAANRGRQFRESISKLSEEFGLPIEVRQQGLHIGVRFDESEHAVRIAELVRQECLTEGLLLGVAGYDKSVLKIKPPLNITEKEMAEVIRRLRQSMGRVRECRIK